MTTREQMIAYRKEHHLTQEQMSKKAHCSRTIIAWVETGDVTHPNIARRMAEAYELTELQAEDLMPLNRREHGGAYEPYKFMSSKDISDYSFTKKGRENAAKHRKNSRTCEY